MCGAEQVHTTLPFIHQNGITTKSRFSRVRYEDEHHTLRAFNDVLQTCCRRKHSKRSSRAEATTLPPTEHYVFPRTTFSTCIAVENTQKRPSQTQRPMTNPLPRTKNLPRSHQGEGARQQSWPRHRPCCAPSARLDCRRSAGAR